MADYEIKGQKVVDLQDGTLPSLQSLSSHQSAGLNISRIPVQLLIRLSMLSHLPKIHVECLVKYRDEVVELEDPVESYNGCIVLKGRCYRFDNSIESILSLFKITKVTDKSEITVSQYIGFRRSMLKYPDIQIEDQVNFSEIREETQRKSGKNPASLKASLYSYQITGFRWLNYMCDQGCGCILGDEMGLGKTLQIITLIASRKGKTEKPSLVVAPVSLLENWRREFQKFTTGIEVFIHHGSKRTGFYAELLRYDVVIISYNTACSDQSLLKMISWDIVVLDEAQNIKNPGAVRTRSVKAIPRTAGIAVTGTPFENHVSDLWSIMDYAVPGCVGTLAEFEKEISDDLEGAERIEPLLTPVMIRRRVKDVAQDLPERVDVPQILTMSEDEIIAYEEVRTRILEEYIGKKAALPMLQKLRMLCTHPLLIDDNYGQDPYACSTKYQRLCELLDEIIELHEKTILFTSYNEMFSILSADIPRRFGIKVYCINGSTPAADRQTVVDAFSSVEGSALLVLNPRAAGTGLNITSASRVIHYNLEWNPALEDQASARAYRRGQKQTVFVYRLFFKDTVEEIINERLENKREIFGTAVIGNDGSRDNNDDIVKALLISPGGNAK